jgi:hypothetical protein
MTKLCVAFYRPLCTLLDCIHTSFSSIPCVVDSHSRGHRALRDQTTDLISELGPGATEALLRTCIAKDADQFFQTPSCTGALPNPLVTFLGGREVYDRLYRHEKDIYWSTLLTNVVRQGMITFAMVPKMATFDSIVVKLAHQRRTTGQQCHGDTGSSSGFDLRNMKHLLQDGGIVNDVMSLVDGKRGMSDLVDMIKTVVSGMTIQQPDAEVKGASSGDDIVNQDVPARTVVAPLEMPPSLSGMYGCDTNTISAGNIFRAQCAADTVAATTIPSTNDSTYGLSVLTGMLSDISKADLDEMQRDIQDMTTKGTIHSILQEACSIIPDGIPSSETNTYDMYTNIVEGLRNTISSGNNTTTDAGDVGSHDAKIDTNTLRNVIDTIAQSMGQNGSSNALAGTLSAIVNVM